MTQFHPAPPHRVIGIHNEDEITLLVRLHGGLRNEKCLARRRVGEYHPHILSRHQQPPGIGNAGAGLQGARGGVYAVGDVVNPANLRINHPVAEFQGHLDILDTGDTGVVGSTGGYFDKNQFTDLKQGLDGIDAHQRSEHARVGAHQVAHTGGTATDTPAYGGGYHGVIEVDLGAGDQGAGRLDVGVRIQLLGHEVVHLRLRDGPPGQQFTAAVVIAFRIGLQRNRRRQVRLGARHGRRVLRRVDGVEHIAGFHQRSLLEIAAHQVAGHQRLDGDVVTRAQAPDVLGAVLVVFFHDRVHHYLHAALGLRRRAAGKQP